MNAYLRRRWWWVVLGVYGCTLGLSLASHEPWRDEIQAWLLARDSNTLGQLWTYTRYEGHPLLWHFLLWLFARFTDKPVAMQLLHAVVAFSAAAVFLAFAPFPRWIRALWIFSYFPLFEYGVISRNYGLTVLCLFLAAAASSNSALMIGALALAAHASPMGVLLVPFLAIQLVPPKKRNLSALLALTAAWVLALLSCLPPGDYEHARGVFLQWHPLRFYYVLRGVATAFYPIFRSELHFWNNPALFPFFPKDLGVSLFLVATLVLGTLLLALVSLGENKKARLAYLAGIAVLGVFFYVKFPGAVRHHGFFAIWTLLCLWVSGDVSGLRGRIRNALLVGLSLLGLQGSFAAVSVDWRHPFSTGSMAAEAIAKHCRGQWTVGHPDWAASTAAGFLPPNSLFYLTTRASGSFVVWNLARAQREQLAEQELVNAAAEMQACLLVNRPLVETKTCSLLAQFSPAIVEDEQFWLYRCGSSACQSPLC